MAVVAGGSDPSVVYLAIATTAAELATIQAVPATVNNVLYYTVDSKVYRYSGSWSIDATSSLLSLIKPLRMAFTKPTYRLFYINADASITAAAVPAVVGVAGPVKVGSGLSVAADGTVSLDSARIPVVKPTLDLDLTKSPLDARFTFARTSNATYFNDSGVMQTAASNTPRFNYDPVTGELLGLLMEEQRINMLLYSSQFDNAVWVNGSQLTVTPNTVVAPDGTTTGYTLASAGATVSENRANQFVTTSVVAGTLASFSVFLRADSPVTTTIRIANNGDGDGVNLAVNLTTSWQRFTVSQTFTGSSTAIRVCINSQATAVTVNAWGAQLEIGLFSTSYISTTSTTVTRVQDSLRFDNLSAINFNPNEGTAVVHFNTLSANPTGFPTPLEISDGTANNRLLLRRTNSGNTFAIIATSGGTTVSAVEPAAITGAQFIKGAITYNSNSAVICMNGRTPLSVTTAAVLGLTTLSLGYRVTSGADCINGHLKRITTYPRKLPSNQVQYLTTL